MLAVTPDDKSEPQNSDVKTFREMWQAKHSSPPTDKKAKLKAASSVMNTMRYYVVVGHDRSLKNVFAEAKVIPLLPDPDCPDQWQDQWTDQGIMETVRRVLCSEATGRYRYDQPTALAAIAAATLFSDNREEFNFVCGLYKGAYPSEIKSVLGHVWKHRVAIKGDNSSDKPSAKEFSRMLRWMFYRLRPHYEELMRFLDDQVLRPES
jgi:hypothetical protein